MSTEADLPTNVVLTLGLSELVVLPPSGRLTLTLPGPGYALVVESGTPVYLPVEEGQRRIEIRPREDLRVKGATQTICGDPGQQVWVIAKARGQKIDGSIARQTEPQQPARAEAAEGEAKKVNLKRG